jgi:MerR family transcriptional regulator/heat shock protein HspR
MKNREDPKKFYHISAVAQMYDIHPQTLRLYEREGLLKPSRSDGNTRLYSEDDLRQLEFILSLTRELGVNLAGVEVVINMKQRMLQIEAEVNEFLDYIRREFVEGQEEEFEQRRRALIRITPGKIVKFEKIERKKDEE